ncbi:MAG: class IV adenylate cyclase [Candidatus Aminicenantes bacterium]|nr:class IV adenylate cyclase [Candidatus Aminicenantes bacterium]
MLEIEIKIKIDDLESAKNKILSAGASLFKNRYFEQNSLYDFPKRDLYIKNQALRLRKINKKTYLTFKGAERKSRKFKIREEFETEIKNERQIIKILKSLGLKTVCTYEKYRTVFAYKKLKICLDELSIGNFLEIEGQQSDIVRFANLLGYSKKDFIKSDYIQMLKRE